MIEELIVKAKEPMVMMYTDITYSQVFVNMHIISRPLKMDLMLPLQPKKAPLILFAEGGAFKTLNHRVALPELIYLAKAGYAVASVEYRLCGEARFPAQIEDLKAALEFLKGKSDEYFIDFSRIGVMGRSAGATLTSLLSAEHPGISAVVNLYGISDFAMYYEEKKKANETEMVLDVSSFLGGYPEDNPDIYKNASAVFRLEGTKIPQLLMYGGRDQVVPLSQGRKLYEMLEKQGTEADLVIIKNAGHGTEGFEQTEIKERIRSFFDKHLR